jgi:hypothetical protein
MNRTWQLRSATLSSACLLCFIVLAIFIPAPRAFSAVGGARSVPIDANDPTCPPEACPPTGEPTGEPTTQPTAEPTSQPTAQPTRQPTTRPTARPTSPPRGGNLPRPAADHGQNGVGLGGGVTSVGRGGRLDVASQPGSERDKGRNDNKGDKNGKTDRKAETPGASRTPSSPGTRAPDGSGASTPPVTKDTLRLDRTVIVAGSSVTARGAGCRPGDVVKLTSGAESLGTAIADSRGSFSAPVEFTSLRPGRRPVTATCGNTIVLRSSLEMVQPTSSTADVTRARIMLGAFALVALIVLCRQLGSALHGRVPRHARR